MCMDDGDDDVKENVRSLFPFFGFLKFYVVHTYK